jgi:type VI secretion system secreted protein VgrG
MSDIGWSLAIDTPLGDGALTLLALDGVETLSQPFQFTLVAASRAPYVDPQALLGRSVDVALKGGDGIARPLNGVVTRVSQDGAHVTLEMRPWLWLLTLSGDHRVFQRLTVVEILQKVFAAYPQARLRNDLVMTYDKLEYCVQYGESDFAFVSRLLETAGIAYRFEHARGEHTLVLVDDLAKYPPCPSAATVPWQALGERSEWLSDARVEAVAFEQALTADGYRTGDYNFRTPATSLATVDGAGKVYEYPGGYELKAAGEAVAKRRGEELAAPRRRLHGASPIRHLQSGTKLGVTGHPAQDVNGGYVLLSVHHSAERRQYENRFTAFPDDMPFRPPRLTPRPRIPGAQTAVVVGPEGKEVWTDEYGRIKLQFHWDRLGQNDADSSCWVRVSQAWAGRGWGAFALPRIGQEVVVSFLDGDPDRPLVTGCVYNGENPVPYALPDNQTRTTLKSRSTPSAEGFNELRFEDKAGEEEVFLQAQKDLTITVLNDRAETVKQNRTVTVQEGDATFTVAKGKSDVEIAGNATETIKGDALQTVSGALTIQVSGDVTIKADGTVTVESGGTLNIKSGAAMSVEAGAALTLKGASVQISGGGATVDLQGGIVKLN